AVHRFQVDLDAERLHRLGQHRLAQQLVGRRDEVVPLYPMHPRLLGEYRRLARSEYSRDPRLQEIAPFELSHTSPPPEVNQKCNTTCAVATSSPAPLAAKGTGRGSR